ncbi:MAG: (2Fe-2S)-binding protein [Bacilli bacterium]|nr:(2Fe-2S)-binding protein [Bacilli bacterium]MBN2877848.1 (2Fe-2S)-binding protein [Bacilli bacterium]
MRIEEHPILSFKKQNQLHFTFNGRPMIGIEGDTIAAALHDNGIMHYSNSLKSHRPRGFYCAIGNCGSCNMKVNGVENIKTCMTLLAEGMVVESELDEVTIDA